MKKYLSFLLVSVYLLCTLDSKAYNTLQVQDVKSTWRVDRGSIDAAVLTVKPSGAYFEYGLYLTFSSKGTTLIQSSDTLEIQYFFDLNPNSIMIDSWLWVDDTIVKALLIDKGQARQIYEGIVNRRKDPSILYKNSQTRYEYRIFPLAGSSSRRVKITWLQPANWSTKTVSAQLPTNMMLDSKTLLSKLRVIALTDSKWADPTLSASGYTFADVDDPFYGKGKEVYINSQNYSSLPSIQYTSPLQNGFYLQAYEDVPNEGYYQLIMLTKQAVDITTKKKTLFIVDYDVSQTSLSRKDVLAELQTAILNNYAAKDSFNILFSNSTVQPVSEKWISGSPENINALFNSIKEEQLSLYSYLQLSLPAGFRFLKKDSQKSNIVLISNSDGLGNYKIANPLIEEISAIDYSPQVNCLDYSTNRRSYYQNSTNYVGNFYLYDYLVKWSGGYYLDAAKPVVPLSSAISSLVNTSEGKIQSLELYTTLADGFCYGRYDQVSTQAQKDAGIVFQVGRYYGKLPVIVRATGFYQDKPFSKEVSFNVTPDVDSLKITRRIWNGNYIYKMETGTVTNDVIKEIIDVSRRNRVLSLYTAFLALEPWLMPKDNYYFYIPEKEKDGTGGSNDVNESIIVNGSDIVHIKAFPNPFTTSLQIECNELAHGVKITSVEIYNSIGNLVKILASDGLGEAKNLQWLGDDNSGASAPNGMYVVVVKTTMGPIRFNVVLNR
ncbi:MAG: hypothetical protein JST20_01915 [Bacteroidetes bacterium]|nr:hypothetical protein [Bacteroidota bacterium]